jgi:hypothetical protein
MYIEQCTGSNVIELQQLSLPPCHLRYKLCTSKFLAGSQVSGAGCYWQYSAHWPQILSCYENSSTDRKYSGSYASPILYKVLFTVPVCTAAVVHKLFPFAKHLDVAVLSAERQTILCSVSLGLFELLIGTILLAESMSATVQYFALPFWKPSAFLCRIEISELLIFVEKGPAAEATDAPQP